MTTMIRPAMCFFLAGLACAIGVEARAGFVYNGVAAGDMTSGDAILWTRGLDSSGPAATNLSEQVSTDPTFNSGTISYNASTDPGRDDTAKIDATGLQSGTRYYYRFQTTGGVTSPVGTFMTAPDPTASVPLHFGFSGDADGQWRPYPVSSGIASKHLDFFTYLGDTIYETASGVPNTSTYSPATGDPLANPAQALADYRRKYLENLAPVTPGGTPGLQSFYAGQGNYTLLDNHELGNKQFQSGGAPAGTPPGAGVGGSNPANDVNTTGTFMNQTPGFQALVEAFKEYQPIREQTVSAPNDPRSDGTLRQYFEQQWGKNAVIFQLDDRSYRDIRLTTASGADDTGPRADNPNRTMLGATQLQWFEKGLLDAQNQGIPWKFVMISSPIDQTGTDGGKSWEGGYRAERNEILKFIADNHIQNVVFLTTDDHQVRISQLTYQPDPNNPNSTAIVPGAFQILDGPLGAGGPNTITDHSFSNIKALADALAASQVAKGVVPVGLPGDFPGLHDVVRLGDPNADSLRQPVDFYSPDTFNYAVLDVSADGRTLTTQVYGINSYPANTFPSAPDLPPEQLILSFAISTVPEPSSAILLLVGLTFTGSLAWKNRCLPLGVAATR